MNKIKQLLPIVFFTIVISGCAGASAKTLIPEQDFVTPTLSAIPPTAILLPQLDIQQSDAHENWTNSVHAQAGNNINCDVCHQLQNGIATKNIAWQNQETNQYESVADSNGLCSKCHTDVNTAEHAHSDQTCVDCHDPHSLTASCLNCHKQSMPVFMAPATPAGGHPNNSPFCEGSGCHSAATQAAQLPFSIHGASHVKVACVACHTAEGFQVGPSPDGSVWLLWREVEINGEKTLMSYQSHNIQLEVDCERCHFEGNPWGVLLLSNN